MPHIAYFTEIGGCKEVVKAGLMKFELFQINNALNNIITKL